MTARPPAQLLDARAALLNDQESRLEAGRHDVVTRGGLGPTARRFYEALTRHGTDDDQVSNRAGMAPSRTLRGLSTSVRSGGEERAGPSFFIGGAGRVRAYASSPHRHRHVRGLFDTDCVFSRSITIGVFAPMR